MLQPLTSDANILKDQVVFPGGDFVDMHVGVIGRVEFRLCSSGRWKYSLGMTTTAAAIYENGVLRPLSPLPLKEGARVEVTVTDDVVHGKRELATGGRTGAELARLWAAMPHLSEEEAAAFEDDLLAARVAEHERPAPKWE